MVKLENVTKYLGDTKVIDNLTFELKKGEITGLLGPNGAGKTTTMRMITSYYLPNEGKITIDGVDTQLNTTETQKKIGFLPENNPLYSDMMVYDFLMMTARLNGVERKKANKKIMEVAKKVDITKKLTANIGELSKGFKQRVGIASTLLHDPSVIILDEPTEGLDPIQRNEIRDLIKELSKNKIILISTHVLQEVKAICNNVIVINNGKLVVSGSPDEIGGKKGLVIKIEGNDIRKKLKEILEKDDEIEVNKLDDGKKEVRIHSKKELRSEISKIAVKNEWTIWEIQSEDSLEELFKDLQK